MPCEKREMPSDVIAIVCSRGRMSKPCVVCGRPAGLLCDWPLTGAKAGKTCDRALCAKHTFRPSTGVDYCPAHESMHRDHVLALKAALGAKGPRS